MKHKTFSIHLCIVISLENFNENSHREEEWSISLEENCKLLSYCFISLHLPITRIVRNTFKEIKKSKTIVCCMLGFIYVLFYNSAL